MSGDGRMISGDPGAIPLGDDGSGKQISFQQAQDFYNEITGKSEQLTERFRDSIVLKFSDVENLCQRIEQTTEQYRVTSTQCNFTVRYMGDSSERFSSLDRLRLHAGNCASAVKELSLEWKFLIVLPKTNRAQEYKLRVELQSRVAMAEEARVDFEDAPFSFPFLQFDRFPTIVATIDFVDYSVALSMMTTVRQWVNGLATTKENRVLTFFRRKAFRWPGFVSLFFVTLVAVHVFFYSDSFFTGPVSQREQVLFSLASLLYFYFALYFGRLFGSIIQRNLNKLVSSSYIHFSKADLGLVDTFTDRNKGHLWRALISFLSSLLIAIISSIVVGALLD